jgi:hypothetical protein
MCDPGSLAVLVSTNLYFYPQGTKQGSNAWCSTWFLVQYVVRCPFSLSRLVKLTNPRQVVYKSEKQACQAFPDPHADDLKAGAKRNFQILSPLDFLAEFAQHPPSSTNGKGSSF